MENDYRLGEWLVQPERGCIERAGEVVHLKPKVMAVLDSLAEAGGKVVKRDDLFEIVWPGQLVSDATLTQCVVELRQAFDDSAKNPQFVETIPKIGFRLIPPVEPLKEDSASEKQVPPGQGTRKTFTRSAGLLAAILIALAVVLAWYLAGSEGEPTGQSENPGASLAVLPFTDVSPDQEQAWIAESLTEQLVSRLSRLEGLNVPGKTLSFTLEDGQADLKAVARELGVDYILEGSVFRDGEDIRINTRILQAADGEIIFAYEWRPTRENFLAMQDIITEGVSHAVSINLEVGELGQDPLGPSDVEAFWSVDTAIRALSHDTRESWLEAVREIENATERDPGYPQAWLWASFIYTMASWKIDDIIHRDWKTLSDNALSEALSLAPDSPDGLNLLIQMYVLNKQFSEAERIIELLGPLESVSHSDLLFRVGVARSHVGRSQEAVVLLERAKSLDTNQWSYIPRLLGWAYLLNGQTDDALEMYDFTWGKEALQRSDCSSEGVNAALVKGDPLIIRKWLMRAQEFNESGMSRFYQAMEEQLDDPLAALAYLRESFENPYEDGNDAFIAYWAAYHGDGQLALEALLRANQEWWLWYPLMASIRNDPQIRQMMHDLGLVDYWREYTWSDFCRPLGEDDFQCGERAVP